MLGLAEPILDALQAEGHKTATPIQEGAIPALLKGHDLLGLAQTGTGKTAAFALPALNRLAGNPLPPEPGSVRILVLAPTRELAAQVLERVNAYGKNVRVKAGLVIGGVPVNKQKNMIRRGVDVLVATPGRLVDLMQQKAVDLSRTEMLILDEVDQMLDLGFIHAIRKISAALPKERQNVFFSATMPPAIAKLAAGMLNDPVRVEVEPEKRGRIDESVLFLDKGAKIAVLKKVLSKDDVKSALVFTRTKRGADRVAKSLGTSGIEAHPIHGNRSQSQRTRALNAFKSGEAKILVATDIAARGIDVSGVTHVVNYELPEVPETYVHRIGRTARAGATGTAIAFCSPDERGWLRQIEKLKRASIPVGAESDPAVEAKGEVAPEKRGQQPSQRRKPAGQRSGGNAARSGKPAGKPGQGVRRTSAAGEGAPRRRRRRAGAAKSSNS